MIRALKYAWRQFGLRQYVLERRLRKNRADWQALAGTEKVHAATLPTDDALLIIPSDPYLLTSSVGDQAMIGSIIGYWEKRNPGLELYFATADAPADMAARRFNGHCIRMMGKDISMTRVAQIMQRHRFKIVVLMGADGMDGSYDPSFSAAQLMVLDIAARTGADCYITGFSISKIFHPDVVDIFGKIDSSIHINLRDPLSLERFETETGRKANQVADVAFLLKPETTPLVQKLIQYINIKKDVGKTTIIVNFHPLLLELTERGNFEELIKCFSSTLIDVSQRINTSIILLSHDNRGESSDFIALKPLYDIIKIYLKDDVIFIEEQLVASEIKALVGSVDMVISGRMHLMIASLGSGTPVLGIDYKDKMEGLLTLLGLDTASLITADAILENPEGCANHIVSYIGDLGTEREKIAQRIGEIKKLSLQNFGAA